MREILLKATVALIAFSCSCSQEQDHEVVGPEWPRYGFGGTISDTLTGDPVPDCTISIDAVELTYQEDDFVADTVVSGADGAFLFSSIPVGKHMLRAAKEGCCPLEGRLQMDYKDNLDCSMFLTKVSDAPDIGVSQNIFDVGLGPGENTDRTVTISNTAGSMTLNWSISNDKAWLTVDPLSGSVSVGESQEANLHFDAAGIFEGQFSTILEIHSNDCVDPVVEVCVKLEVL